MRTRTRLLAVAIAVIGAVCAIAALLVSGRFAGDDDRPRSITIHPTADNPSRRFGELAICVQSVGTDPTLDDRVKVAFEQALASIDTRGVETLVHVGCPHPPARMTLGGARLVSQPSYYSVFVFIISDDEFDRLFPSRPGFVDAVGRSGADESYPSVETPEEETCGGHVCYGDTSGHYMTPAAIDIGAPQVIVYRLFGPEVPPDLEQQFPTPAPADGAPLPPF